MKASLEPFVAEHGVEILGPDCRDFLNFLLRCQYEGPAYTARLEDGRILGCAGCIQELPYSATAWMIPTPLVVQYPLLFHRMVIPVWQSLVDKFQWRRVQTLVDPEYPERVRWIQRMGFVKEGCQRAGGDHGQDLWYYGWLRENGNGTSGNRHCGNRGQRGIGGSRSVRISQCGPAAEEGPAI